MIRVILAGVVVGLSACAPVPNSPVIDAKLFAMDLCINRLGYEEGSPQCDACMKKEYPKAYKAALARYGNSPAPVQSDDGEKWRALGQTLMQASQPSQDDLPPMPVVPTATRTNCNMVGNTMMCRTR